jgi:uncharacterized surface protein with fasciclin (FAS1) repeats
MQHQKKFLHHFRTVSLTAFVLAISMGSVVQAGGHKSAAPAASAAPGDIVEVAVSTGSFNTLVAAAQAADLVDALKGDGPLTLFAPTDEAFAALPDGTVENLLKPENQSQLQAVLLYHVVPGKVMKKDLQGTVNAETLEGSSIVIVKGEGWTEKQRAVTVNGANVVAADVAASNGVIHVVDAVLLPPQA